MTDLDNLVIRGLDVLVMGGLVQTNMTENMTGDNEIWQI
jgi:hypothetical protein